MCSTSRGTCRRAERPSWISNLQNHKANDFVLDNICEIRCTLFTAALGIFRQLTAASLYIAMAQAMQHRQQLLSYHPKTDWRRRRASPPRQPPSDCRFACHTVDETGTVLNALPRAGWHRCPLNQHRDKRYRHLSLL